MNYEYDLYNKADHTARIEDSFLTRREWLQKTGTGFGALALSAMMAEQGLMGQSKGGSPLAPKQPPGQPKPNASSTSFWPELLHTWIYGTLDLS